MLTNLRQYKSNNYYRAEDMDPNVRQEEIVVAVSDRLFEEKDGTTKLKPILHFESGMSLVLNDTRLDVVVAACGPNPDNVIGAMVTVFRSTTRYGSDPKKPCVAIEVTPPASKPALAQPAAKPAIENKAAPADVRPAPARGRAEIPSALGGARRWDRHEDPPAPPSDGGDGPDPNDDVDF
jgi:hypothetical protein